MNAPLTSRVFAPSVTMTLDVLAAEIELAGARCIFLDRIIGEAMDRLPEAERDRLVPSLHTVDLLAQHLTNLSAFARGLSLAVPGDVTAPVEAALSEVTLGALVDRMAAGMGRDEALLGNVEAPDEDPGDLDLF
jgi:hypothetical protein